MKKLLSLLGLALALTAVAPAAMQAQNTLKSLEGKWKTSLEEEATVILSLKEEGALEFGIIAEIEEDDGAVVVSMGGTWTFTPSPEGPGLGILEITPTAEDFSFEYLGSNAEMKAFFALFSESQKLELGKSMAQDIEDKQFLVVDVNDETLTVREIDEDGNVDEETEPQVFERAQQ
ncbi:MAG: hypothetical protein IJ692_04995 [Alloprevotella sp.]|nr:hypothetical protein [Alloprevotella sp.]